MSTRSLGDQRRFLTRVTWVVFVKLEGWVRLRVVFEGSAVFQAPPLMQEGVWVWVGRWLSYIHR